MKYFIDVFAGCGGLSLGFSQAGLRGLFSIEKSRHAFLTFSENFLSPNSKHRFLWPRWLKKEPLDIQSILSEHKSNLRALRGKVHVVAGGPPCQGFSTAGRRRADDPRNHLFVPYIELIDIVQPPIVFLENVRGFTVGFSNRGSLDRYSEEFTQAISSRYRVFDRLIDVSCFGVPQQRVRYFAIGIERSLAPVNPFEMLDDYLPAFLRKKNLQAPTSAWAAISDLEVSRGGTRRSSEDPRFLEICPSTPRTAYQRLMRSKDGHAPDLRLARHSPDIKQRFEEIIKQCHAQGHLGISVTKEMREKFGLKKVSLRVLDPDRPSPTITSMPDDLLHYAEPRALTVRENARLQSFPDWFAFYGKYTSGGHLRQTDVPRFTQVANAVPPLAAEAIGIVIGSLLGQRNPRELVGQVAESFV